MSVIQVEVYVLLTTIYLLRLKSVHAAKATQILGPPSTRAVARQVGRHTCASPLIRCSFALKIAVQVLRSSLTTSSG